ncbi:ATPase family associated with various cellular activities (AAA) [Paenibacillus sp. UNCCL117]|uniref:AAA family ATPase n=1 Tax=unclassified Paenibacillus TaxID=185978 RepID=UPI00088C3A54|nr:MULTISPECIES: ATP-binding protein [unclassified Paenibacillus]SDD68522.1 ATPase family associated with various cellular activities (AAA) [Paenibacillus sp. cl123]SFW44927.1 ATPase family associated with various cellular activities (AAA) [Paenibacillus sp. UNCCL117]
MSKNKNSRSLPKSKGMETAAVYSPADCAVKVKRIVLQPGNRQILEEFIAILGMKEKFAEHDVPIPNKIVMFGPPGTGKTLTAFYMAQRLELPLIVVRLDAVINSFLGETASNVRKLFDYAKSSPCVLFLDEFDAIARTRENNDEVKEMSRVVNTLLQCLDEFEGGSVLMAATNLEEELDHAVWRRFDTRMTYRLPDDADREEYVRLMAAGFEHEKGVAEKAVDLLQGTSFADMEQIYLKAKRKAIIASSSLTYGILEASYREYQPRKQA